MVRFGLQVMLLAVVLGAWGVEASAAQPYTTYPTYSGPTTAPRTATPAPNAGGMSRQEIRSMPMMERPSRPGHFYGNTMRRFGGR